MYIPYLVEPGHTVGEAFALCVPNAKARARVHSLFDAAIVPRKEDMNKLFMISFWGGWRPLHVSPACVCVCLSAFVCCEFGGFLSLSFSLCAKVNGFLRKFDARRRRCSRRRFIPNASTRLPNTRVVLKGTATCQPRALSR